MIPAHQIPNLFTILRLLLIVPFAISVYMQRYQLSLMIFFVAGISDGIDGFLARQFNWRSRFGAIADPLADKLLLITAYIMLAWTAQIPIWLTILVLFRDLVIVVGALVYHYFISHYEIKPSIFGKACTMVQIVYVLAVVISLAELPMPDIVVTEGVYLVAAITAISGLHYVIVWTVKGWQELMRK